MNIVPQEMVANGERTLRYKGSDGKLHDITAKWVLPTIIAALPAPASRLIIMATAWEQR